MTTLPAWLDQLVEAVVACTEAYSAMGEFGFRYCPPEDSGDELWVIYLYPTPVAIQGGADDGTMLTPCFSLDLAALYAVFDTVVACHWIAHPISPEDQDHPAITLEGRYQGYLVYLTLQAYPPEDEPPGMMLDLTDTEQETRH